MAPVPRVKHHVSADATQSRCRGYLLFESARHFRLKYRPVVMIFRFITEKNSGEVCKGFNRAAAFIGLKYTNT